MTHPAKRFEQRHYGKSIRHVQIIVSGDGVRSGSVPNPYRVGFVEEELVEVD